MKEVGDYVERSMKVERWRRLMRALDLPEKLDVYEDDLGLSLLALSADPTAVDDDPIEALFLSADASRDVIDREAALADVLAEMEPEEAWETI